MITQRKISVLLLITVCLFCFCKEENSDNFDIQALEDDVWQVVKAHNKSWTVLEDLDEQAKYIHDDIVFINPEDRYPVNGKAAYREGYNKWIKAAEVHFFKELDHKVRIMGNGKGAVVTYNIDMSFNYEGKENTFKGRDLFFLVKENKKWFIAANEFSPYPKKNSDTGQ